jgi:hypothetical protein
MHIVTMAECRRLRWAEHVLPTLWEKRNATRVVKENMFLENGYLGDREMGR